MTLKLATYSYLHSLTQEGTKHAALYQQAFDKATGSLKKFLEPYFDKKGQPTTEQVKSMIAKVGETASESSFQPLINLTIIREQFEKPDKGNKISAEQFIKESNDAVMSEMKAIANSLVIRENTPIQPGLVENLQRSTYKIINETKRALNENGSGLNIGEYIPKVHSRKDIKTVRDNNTTFIDPAQKAAKKRGGDLIKPLESWEQKMNKAERDFCEGNLR